MKILYQDSKSGRMKLLIESLDDLWHLYNLIEKGDLAIAFTYRRGEEAKADKLRPERLEKKRMKLTIKVEDIEFHEFAYRLRIHGIIKEGVQDLGQFHTLNITVGDDLTIQKEKWEDTHLQRIKEAIEASKQSLITLLAIDYDEATFAVLRQYGIRHVATISSHISGKQFETSKNEKVQFYEELLAKLRLLNLEAQPLIILGPGFAKEEFYSFGRSKEPKLFENCYIQATGQTGMAGIQELMKSGMSIKLLADSRVAYETKLVEQLLEEISTDGLYSYGFEDVKKALEYGAVELLIVIDKAVRDHKLTSIFDLAKQKRTKLIVISSSHEAGKKLEALGGMGAILRFRV